ncbi:MAG: membrane or secreted protein [Cyclobacteriaceae bacterium]|nr:membrane or secreted protein [Cyclobacteriaceae bacterium]MDH5251136.1 membrane or secreted protein [Cyclobacteriaceae bacterium]
MKYTSLLINGALLISVCLSIDLYGQHESMDLKGAWQRGPEENRIVWINSEKHFSAAVYNSKENIFLGTSGGTWKLEGNTLVEVHEFNTIDPDLIGKEIRNEVKMSQGKLVITEKDKEETWTRLDDTTPGKLAGAWIITGRINDGQLRKMTPGARKTMKILSGTRFQWIAYNSETKEFFGTGGGTYTTENGKYTEHIDFFSRDNSRVGMQLEFDFSIDDGQWHHQGLSSKGSPINEIWTKREKLGI